MPLDAVIQHAPLTPLMQPGDVSNILFGVGVRDLSWVTSGGQPVPFTSHKAIIRGNNLTNKPMALPLAIVSNTYKVITNRELLTSIENTMIEVMSPASLIDVHIVDSVAQNGKTCYRDYTFHGITCDIGAMTPVAFRLVVQNGYGGSAVRLIAGAIEFYCSNGMITGKYDSKYARHTSGVKIADFRKFVLSALHNFTTATDKWKKWVKTPVINDDVLDFFTSLAITSNLRENLITQHIVERHHRGPNLWSVYSAMTNYASHSDGLFPLRKTDENSNAATIMFNRGLDVDLWSTTDAFKRIEMAAA